MLMLFHNIRTKIQKKLRNYKKIYLSYFPGKCFFDDDGFQNMLVYQPIFNTSDLKKKDKVTEYVIGWESKGVYASKRIPSYTAFLHNIKLFGYKIGIQFNKSILV